MTGRNHFFTCLSARLYGCSSTIKVSGLVFKGISLVSWNHTLCVLQSVSCHRFINSGSPFMNRADHIWVVMVNYGQTVNI